MTAVSLAPAWVDDDLGYSEFYQRYYRPLTSYLRMGFRDADVEAVVQETFCRALAHWPEVRHMAAPWSWLAVTARNLARNNIRDGRSTLAAGLDVFDPVASSGDDVAEQVEASESLRRLAQAMTSLTPLQKRLVTVMIEEGLTGAQLARRLGMRPGAVRMHLCRMRLRLGDRFAALGGVLGVGPVALLGVLRRFRVKSQAGLAGSAALSAVVTAVGIAVIGVMPSVPFLANGTAQAPNALSVTHVTRMSSDSAYRAAATRSVTRVAAPPAKHAPANHVVAASDPVNVAGEVRTGRAAVEMRGDHETAMQVVQRCLRHVTLGPYNVRCEGSGTGTQ
ncbi:MAG: polymerase sigma-70 factor, subfamily [Actinomycetota bacterium]|jgi:RNA polymerase sigma factor (sigma-70 family)|nr:polymerase sigma-70 factor, subfamily [Actinomycetota bacterium]